MIINNIKEQTIRSAFFSAIIILFTSCSSNKLLQNTKFSDGMVFVSRSVLAQSYSYEFKKNEYRIFCFDNNYIPKTYMIENGKYKLKKGKIYFYPALKLVCKINSSMYLCHGAFQEGIYVSKDTLDIRNIINLSFNKQFSILSEKEGQLEFKNNYTKWGPMKQNNNLDIIYFFNYFFQF